MDEGGKGGDKEIGSINNNNNSITHVTPMINDDRGIVTDDRHSGVLYNGCGARGSDGT